jgi:2-polyprenyl-3-methyl-5-hydroxy-6-metoxy-1,4-benzoquinol methylase
LIPLETRPRSYYGQERANVIAELPRPLGRVLDVGCGEGGANDSLRAAGASAVTGIEIVPEAAARAAERYDRVEVGDAKDALQRIEGPFDTILCYDILEHLVDPESVLGRLRELAAERSRLHVSIPNARHWSLLRDLVIRGTFGYTEWGHRDATHLRWFTRSDMRQLLSEAGWTVEATTSSAGHRLRELGVRAPQQVVNALGGEFLGRAWYIIGRPAA